jgi:predicted outer membrane protein
VSFFLHGDPLADKLSSRLEDRMGRSWLLWIVFAGIFIAGCSKKEGTKPEPASVGTGGAGADVRSDGDFVHDVALKNMAEIELSRAALDKATRPDIKAFAQIMINDHGAAGDKLKSILSGHPIEWPAQLDDKHRQTADELVKKHGTDFDRAYVKAMVEGHQDLAAKLESRLDVQSLADWKTAAAARTESKALPEPNGAMHDVAVRPIKSDTEITMKITQWAADIYPIAQRHLDIARTLENATKKGSTD